MRRNVKNDKVLRAITIGLATMIAVTSTPVTVFAEGNDENDDTQQVSNSNEQNNTEKTDVEKTSEAIDEAKEIRDNVNDSEKSDTDPQGVQYVDGATQNAVTNLKNNVSGAEVKNPTSYNGIIVVHSLPANGDGSDENASSEATTEVSVNNFVSEAENNALNGEDGVFALAGELKGQVESEGVNVEEKASHLVGNGTGNEGTNEELTAMKESLEKSKGIDERRSQKDDNDESEEDRLTAAINMISDLVADIDNNPEKWIDIEGYNTLISDTEGAGKAAEDAIKKAQTQAEVEQIVNDYKEKLRLAKEDRQAKLDKLSNLKTSLLNAQKTLESASQDYSEYNTAVSSFGTNKTKAIADINAGKDKITSLQNKVNTLLKKVEEAENAYITANDNVKTALGQYISGVTEGIGSAQSTLNNLAEPTEKEIEEAGKLASVEDLKTAKETSENEYKQLVNPKNPDGADLSGLEQKAAEVDEKQAAYDEAVEIAGLRTAENERKAKLEAYNETKSIYGEKASEISSLKMQYDMAEYMGSDASVIAKAYDAWQEALEAERIINNAASAFATADETFVSGLIMRNLKEELNAGEATEVPEITVTKGKHDDLLDKDVYVASYTKEDENGNEVTTTISYIYDTVTDSDKEWIEIKPVEKVNVKTGEGKYISTDYGCSDGKDFVFQSDRDVVEGSIWYEDIWTDSGEYWYSKVHYLYVHHGRNDTTEIIDAVVEDPKFADLKPDQRYLAVYKYDKSYQPIEGKESYSEKAFYQKYKDADLEITDSDPVSIDLAIAKKAKEVVQKTADYNLKKNVTDYSAASEYVSDNSPKLDALKEFLEEYEDSLDYGNRLMLYGAIKDACGSELSNLNVYSGKFQTIYNAIVNLQAGNVKSTEVLNAQLMNLTNLLGVKREDLEEEAAEEGGILNYLKTLIDKNDERISDLDGFIESIDKWAAEAKSRIEAKLSTIQGGVNHRINDFSGGDDEDVTPSSTTPGTGTFVTYTTPDNEFTLIPVGYAGAGAGAGAGAQAGGRMVASNRAADRSGVLGVRADEETDTKKAAVDTTKKDDNSSSDNKGSKDTKETKDTKEQNLVKVENNLVPLADTPFEEDAGMNWAWLLAAAAAAGAGAYGYGKHKKAVAANEEMKKYKK